MTKLKTGRKPAHLTMQKGKATGRQAIWEAIRTQKEQFTRKDIETVSKVNIGTIDTYLKSLIKAGFVEVSGEIVEQTLLQNRTKTSKTMTLIKDTGFEAPRVNRNGELCTQGLANEQLWRSMKMINDFNFDELIAIASTDEIIIARNTAKSYVLALCKAGYIARVKQGLNPRYQMIKAKYTGSRPPMIQRLKSVFDQNLGKIVWQEDADV